MNNDRYGLRGRRLCTLAFASAVLLSGCHSQILIKRDSPQFRDTTGQWTQAIAERGKNGDWLVIRGYHDADNVVAVATNARLSHVAIFDADRSGTLSAEEMKNILTRGDNALLSAEEVDELISQFVREQDSNARPLPWSSVNRHEDQGKLLRTFECHSDRTSTATASSRSMSSPRRAERWTTARRRPCRRSSTRT